MWKLMKLEWKKNRIGKYVKKAVILALMLSLFLFAFVYLGIANDPDTGVPDAATGSGTISASVEMFTSMSFLILSSVMLSSFLVSAYKNGTMDLMFSYPIRRQKILASEMLAVWIFNFAALVLTKLAVYGCILWGSFFRKPAFPIDFDMTGPDFYIQLIVKAAVIVTMSFISLFIGLAAKSSKAAIVSSFVLILLTQANIGDYTMAGNAVFSFGLTSVSLVFAFFSIWKAETADLM